MTSLLNKLEKQWDALQNGGVIYFSATDAGLLREGEKAVSQRWKDEGKEAPTRLDGPQPDLGELIAAAGAISLFGGTRQVILRELAPASLSDKDAKELTELFGDLENALLLVTALHKDKRAAGSKKAKMLFEAAAKSGFAAELQPPTKQENLAFLQQTAQNCGGAGFAPGAAEELLERCGPSRPLLQNETEKLAAISAYGQIACQTVRRYSVNNIEADVFELVRLITAGRRGPAQEKLAELFELRHEPVAITAALGGSFVDMLRVRTGAECRKAPAAVFTDMGYKGSDYRLVKAKENAQRYSTKALEQGVLALAKLDRDLKSNPLSDKNILLQAAVEDLIRLREGP